MGPVGDEFCCVQPPSAVSLQAVFWICIGSSNIGVWCSGCDLFTENAAPQVKQNKKNPNTKRDLGGRIISKNKVDVIRFSFVDDVMRTIPVQSRTRSGLSYLED